MFMTSRESAAITCSLSTVGCRAPTLEACAKTFSVVLSGGKLQVRARYIRVNIGGSSENFGYLPILAVFQWGSWYFCAGTIPKCCVRNREAPQLIVVLTHTVHYFASDVTKDLRLG